MSSVVAHAVSASWVAVTFAQVQPHESAYLLAAWGAAAALDLDHVLFVMRDRARYRQTGYQGHLHHARSVLHELAGLTLAGALAALLFVADPRLARVVFVAFAIHVAQDWVTGRSWPLAPVDRTEVQFFALTYRQKVIVDITTVVVFGALWIRFLLGAP